MINESHRLFNQYNFAIWLVVGIPIGFFMGLAVAGWGETGTQVAPTAGATVAAPVSAPIRVGNDQGLAPAGDVYIADWVMSGAQMTRTDTSFKDIVVSIRNVVPAWVIGRIPNPTDPTSPKAGCNPVAQNKEDLTAYHNFFYNRPPGIILESGGYDPNAISTSYFFEMCLGWHSMHIEPSPSKYAKFEEFRPNALNINAAICSHPQQVHFMDGGGVGGIVEFMSDKHIAQYFSSKENAMSQSAKITCIPLMDLLRLYGIKHIDLWILDIENAELEVLKGMDMTQVDIDVIIIEDANQQRAQFSEVLAATHDLVGFANPNLVYKRKVFTPSPSPEVGNYVITPLS